MKSVLLLLLFLGLSTCARNDHSVPIVVPVKELSNGVKMPVLGLGTALSRPGQVEPAIVSATVAGYRLIDTADVYENEEAIGGALQFLITNGSLKREDLFITTKLPPSHFAPDQVMSKLSEQLIRLKLDYVDLYLMHFPAAMKPDGTMDTTVKPEDTWKEMEKLYKEGKARAIGVSNFNASQIHRILKIAKTPPHVLQVETHVHFVQKDLQKLCDENNITMEAYAPLGAPGRPPYLLPKGHPYPWPPGPKPLLNPQVLKLAGKYGKPPASILLRYLIQRGLVAIPKSVSPERIYENIQVFDFKLTDKEMEKLSNQTPQKRVYPQEWIKGHPEDPFAGER